MAILGDENEHAATTTHRFFLHHQTSEACIFLKTWQGMHKETFAFSRRIGKTGLSQADEQHAAQMQNASSSRANQGGSVSLAGLGRN
jgi:lauroyl/myristoyl acyltransferase